MWSLPFPHTRFRWQHIGEIRYTVLEWYLLILCFQLVHWLSSGIVFIHSSSSNMFFKIAKWLLENGWDDFEGISKNYYFSNTVCFQLNSGEYGKYNSSSKNQLESKKNQERFLVTPNNYSFHIKKISMSWPIQGVWRLLEEPKQWYTVKPALGKYNNMTTIWG